MKVSCRYVIVREFPIEVKSLNVKVGKLIA